MDAWRWIDASLTHCQQKLTNTCFIGLLDDIVQVYLIKLLGQSTVCAHCNAVFGSCILLKPTVFTRLHSHNPSQPLGEKQGEKLTPTTNQMLLCFGCGCEVYRLCITNQTLRIFCLVTPAGVGSSELFLRLLRLKASPLLSQLVSGETIHRNTRFEHYHHHTVLMQSAYSVYITHLTFCTQLTDITTIK